MKSPEERGQINQKRKLRGQAQEPTIERLRSEHLDSAKAVITAGCLEFFGSAPKEFEDMDAVEAHYAPPHGIFLVLVENGKVVGTGAIRRLTDEICELKRMWLLPDRRGKGHGTAMTRSLIDFAKSSGYLRVRLDTDTRLEAAAKLYRRLGFEEIPRYNDGPCSAFFEKEL